MYTALSSTELLRSFGAPQIFLSVQRGAGRSGERRLQLLLLLQSYWSCREPQIGLKAALTTLVLLFHVMLLSEHHQLSEYFMRFKCIRVFCQLRDQK